MLYVFSTACKEKIDIKNKKSNKKTADFFFMISVMGTKICGKDKKD